MCESIIAACKSCGKSFHPSKYKSSKFCGIPCYREHQRSGNYKTRESKRAFVCAHCGSAVTGRSPQKSLKSDGKPKIYCGRLCYDASRSLAQEKLKKKCAGCGENFYRPGVMADAIYCSFQCRKKHNKPKPVECISCKLLFSALQIRSSGSKWYVRLSSRKTCSAECLSMFHKTNEARKEKISRAFRADRHPNWQGGTHRSGNRGAGWNRIAEKCRDIHGRKCKHCGISEAHSLQIGWGKLQVNHITPFHQILNKQSANRQSNLEALCKSCHTIADWKWRKENAVQLSLSIFR